MCQNRFDHVDVVFDPESVRHGEEKSIRFGDSFISSQLFDERIWLRCI